MAHVIESADARRELEIIAAERVHDPCAATLDLDSLAGPFTVRCGVRGDMFRPYGHKSAKPLARFLGRMRVPVWRRDLAPVLVADGKIAWVAGLEIDDSCRVVPESRRLLKVRLETQSG